MARFAFRKSEPGFVTKAPSVASDHAAGVADKERISIMANTLVQDLIEAGIHFGQRSSSDLQTLIVLVIMLKTEQRLMQV